MSNNPAPIPKGAVFFAQQILNRFQLDKASSIDFIEKAIAAAVHDQQDINRAQEIVGCTLCGLILYRYACAQERFGSSCPKCRGPMAARDVLQAKRIGELEEQLRALEKAHSPTPSV